MTDIKQPHATEVHRIQMQVRSFFEKKQKVRIYHGSTNSTRAVRFDRNKIIDISSLNRILEINATEQYVVVEPNVPMDKLVEATLKFGLVPPVVMEFPGITVGGGIQGGAGESSSFQAGLFHTTCTAYEIVIGNGELLQVTPWHHPDLFNGTAGSYGSLGIITLVTLRLVPAKSFVLLKYRAVESFSEAIQVTRQQVSQAVNFVDGILFAKNSGVIMSGTFTDRRDLPISTFRQPFDEWFYLHAQSISNKHTDYEERIPIMDYLFRYDRGGFWVGRFAFRLTKFPYRRIFRALLHKVFTTRSLFRILHATKLTQRYLVQDISLPHQNVLPFLEQLDRQLNVYPLWLCPLKPGQHDRLSPAYIPTDLVINVGAWGETHRDFSQFILVNRELEKLATDLNGRKVLYSYQYYTHDEFWNIYDEGWYKNLRSKFHAENVFPDIYEKTRVTDIQKPTVLAGIWELLSSPFRLPVS